MESNLLTLQNDSNLGQGELSLERLLDEERFLDKTYKYMRLADTSLPTDDTKDSPISQLTRPSIVKRLIEYAANSSDLDNNNILRYVLMLRLTDFLISNKPFLSSYMNISCDLLLSIVQIQKSIELEPEKYLDLLLIPLKNKDLPRFTMRCILKVFAYFLHSCILNKPVLSYLKCNPWVGEMIFSYTNDYGVLLDFIPIFLNKDEVDLIKDYVQDFLLENKIMKLLVSNFSSSNSENHMEVAELICLILDLNGVDVLNLLFDKEVLETLFEKILENGNKSALTYSLPIISKIIRFIGEYERNIEYSQSTALEEFPIINFLLENIGKIKDKITNNDDRKPQVHPAQVILTPVGSDRLAVVDLIDAMLDLEYNVVDDKIIELGYMKFILDLFFQANHNSLLCKKVESILCQILDGRDEQLIMHILQGECDLPSRIVESNKLDPILMTCPEDSITRRANSAFLFFFVNRILKLSYNESVAEILYKNDEWNKFINHFNEIQLDSEIIPVGALRSHYNSDDSDIETEQNEIEEDDVNIPDESDIKDVFFDLDIGNCGILLSKQEIEDLITQL